MAAVASFKHRVAPSRAVHRTSRVSRSARLHQPMRVVARGLEGRPWVELKDCVPVAGPDLSVTVNGLKFPNPFVIGSGPPGTNYTVMKKAFDEGWGGVIAKTVSLNADLVKNVTPRYAKLKSEDGNEVIGWQNIELISDRPLEDLLEDFVRLKADFPDQILIASIMEQCARTFTFASTIYI